MIYILELDWPIKAHVTSNFVISNKMYGMMACTQTVDQSYDIKSMTSFCISHSEADMQINDLYQPMRYVHTETLDVLT